MTKVIVSKKQIISIEEFMENYIGKTYEWNEKLTHKNMNLFLIEKGVSIPDRINFKKVQKEKILNGDYVVVKDNASQIIVYSNPRHKSLSTLLAELKASSKNLKDVRKKQLTQLGYKEEYGEVVKNEQAQIEEYITEKINRQKQFVMRSTRCIKKSNYR